MWDKIRPWDDGFQNIISHNFEFPEVATSRLDCYLLAEVASGLYPGNKEKILFLA